MRNPKTDFKAEISVFEVSILPFDWESEKGFEKLSFRTVVLPTSFRIRVRLQNLKSGFPNQTRPYISSYFFPNSIEGTIKRR